MWGTRIRPETSRSKNLLCYRYTIPKSTFKLGTRSRAVKSRHRTSKTLTSFKCRSRWTAPRILKHPDGASQLDTPHGRSLAVWMACKPHSVNSNRESQGGLVLLQVTNVLSTGAYLLFGAPISWQRQPGDA